MIVCVCEVRKYAHTQQFKVYAKACKKADCSSSGTLPTS